MNFWRRAELAWKAITSSPDLARAMAGGRVARTGHDVTVETAFQVQTHLACCRVKAEGLAQVPIKLYRRGDDGRRTPATDHPLHDLVRLRPNPVQTSFELREQIGLHLAASGNALLWLNKVGSRRETREIWGFEPRLWSVEKPDAYSLRYHLATEGGARREIAPEQVWHIRGPSWDGRIGLDALRLLRHALGLAMALEDQAADLMRNAGQVGGVLSVKNSLSSANYERLKDAIAAQAREKKYEPLVVDQDGRWTPTTMTGVDAQHLEQRRHQVEEICRGHRVLPIMIGHPADIAARAAVESMTVMHQIYTMHPLYERVEQSADAALLSDEERAAGFYFKFTPNALMRVPAKDRAEYYAKALGAGGSQGWMTPNQVRDLEEMDRDPSPEADMIPRAATAAPPSDAADDEDDGEDAQNDGDSDEDAS